MAGVIEEHCMFVVRAVVVFFQAERVRQRDTSQVVTERTISAGRKYLCGETKSLPTPRPQYHRVTGSPHITKIPNTVKLV
jgi:hypothetical protein